VLECMRVWRMRTGISITLKPADRRRLKGTRPKSQHPHKHVWGAEIVLLSANDVGTNEIMLRTGKWIVSSVMAGLVDVPYAAGLALQPNPTLHRCIKPRRARKSPDTRKPSIFDRTATLPISAS
jgi:hypothetical protein